MDWVKKNWLTIVCGVVALAGVGIGVWAMLGFNQIQAKADEIARVGQALDGLRGSPANLAAIEDARKYFEVANRQTKEEGEKAKVTNKREPLLADVFPGPGAADSPYTFRTLYKEAMRRLPQDFKAEKAPTGDSVDRIVGRMEEKARKVANVATAGDQLRIPKPPDAPRIESLLPTAPTPVMNPADDRRGGGRGEDPYRSGGRGEDPYRGGGRGEDPYRSGRGDDPYRAGPAPIAPRPIPGAATGQPTQPAVKIPTKEELLPKARQLATYETAKRIWTYIDDGSLEMHPISSSVTKPEPDDMWAAQVFYWIEKDVIDALRRVNEQAAANLPENQRWVAYLPVKHLVSLGISEYLAGSVADVSGRSSSITLLRKSNLTSGMGRAAGRATTASYGNPNVAFTGRTNNAEYDVVHIALNVVVDARDLPKVLKELSLQNFMTPLDVQYSNVDVAAAREAGYVYGAGPVIDADIVCEVLFFRSIFDPLKPEKVKKILAGEPVEDPSGRNRGR